MDHTVVITFDQDRRPVALGPDGHTVNPEVRVLPGDRLCFVSPHGQVRVRFENGSPLEKGQDGGQNLLGVVGAVGSYPYRCGVTITENGSAKTIGWPTTNIEGGTVVVDHDPVR
jgi:hypothetical protein